MNKSKIERLDSISREAVATTLRECCGAVAWCRAMAASHPFGSADRLHQCADHAFDHLTHDDWREAFACHPKIGDLDSLRMKFAGNDKWSAGEQSGVAAAAEQTICDLAAGNAEYEKRFGYIFIVCATGKTATEMLAMLLRRLANDPATEFDIAAAEQRKITHLRLDKLIQPQGGHDEQPDHNPRP